ncbi:MAG: hypothetical protein KC736_00650 [Candidatus Moranbacteria bacterium]|nr:hypothetical protein [Candidatus Moranbacteria bacterium]
MSFVVRFVFVLSVSLVINGCVATGQNHRRSSSDGAVVSHHNTPVAFAQVELRQNNNRVTCAVVTDMLGCYFLLALHRAL